MTALVAPASGATDVLCPRCERARRVGLAKGARPPASVTCCGRAWPINPVEFLRMFEPAEALAYRKPFVVQLRQIRRQLDEESRALRQAYRQKADQLVCKICGGADLEHHAHCAIGLLEALQRLVQEMRLHD